MKIENPLGDQEEPEFIQPRSAKDLSKRGIGIGFSLIWGTNSNGHARGEYCT
jgi:hypothetical protein